MSFFDLKKMCFPIGDSDNDVSNSHPFPASPHDFNWGVFIVMSSKIKIETFNE